MAKIVFVDENDREIGAGTREEAITKGIIHRASHVYLLNSKGELLIQKRAKHLSSNPGKWGESAAGHVDEGESYSVAAYREMEEEIGVRNVTLTELIKIYMEFDEIKTKKRFNTLFSGIYNNNNGEIKFNPEEVSEVRWLPLQALKDWMARSPEDFAEGFRKSFEAFQTLKNRT